MKTGKQYFQMIILILFLILFQILILEYFNLAFQSRKNQFFLTSNHGLPTALKFLVPKEEIV
jgi:hypothetical protein